MELMAEYRDMLERHPCRAILDTPCPKPKTVHRYSGGVERWRPLVQQYFGKNTDKALRVMACESRGNPNAKNRRSSASGLFQFLSSTWKTWGVGDVFDPEANVAAAARLSHGGTTWRAWSCG